MILNNLYYSDDHFVIKYNENKFVKIFYKNDNINFDEIKKINRAELNEILDAYILYQFPFTLMKKSNEYYELSFLSLLNSKIVFSIECDKLKCLIKIDNNIVGEYFVQNKQNNLLKVHLKNVNDVDRLTYIENIEIYECDNCNDFYLIIPPYKYREIKKISDQYGWEISIQ